MRNYRVRIMLVAFLICATVLLASCRNMSPALYVAAKTEEKALAKKQNEFIYWSGKIKERRQQFELDMDNFVVSTLLQAEREDALSADGVAYLYLREANLRASFDANERQVIAAFEEHLRWFDEIAAMQREVINAEIEASIATSQAITQLSAEVAVYTQQVISQAAERREERLRQAAMREERREDRNWWLEKINEAGEHEEIIEEVPTETVPEPSIEHIPTTSFMRR